MSTSESQVPLQQRIVQQALAPLEEGAEMMRRFRDVEALEDYLKARLPLIIGACMLLIVVAVTLGLTPAMYLVGTQALSTLLGILLVPVVTLGAAFVLGFAFFSWLEERSIALSLRRGSKSARGTIAHWLKRKLGVELGGAPRVPWLHAAIFVFLPYALLITRSTVFAVILLLALVAMPLVYARFER